MCIRDSANPVGQIMKVNGNNFEVVGVYGARVEPDTPSAYQTDNFMILPYTFLLYTSRCV